MVRRQQVEVEVLFHDGEIGGSERDGFRTDLPRYILKLESLPAPGEIDGAVVLHERHIARVDRNREVSGGTGRCAAKADGNCDPGREGSHATRAIP